MVDIKKFAKEGQMNVVKIMARDLVRCRTYISKFIELKSHLQGALLKLQTVKSHAAMAESMGSVAKAMVSANKSIKVQAIDKMLSDFIRENEKAEVTMEIMGDAMDDIAGTDEEEEDLVVNQVLDEIGIQVDGEVPEPPSKEPQSEPQEEVKDEAVDELEKRLNNLRR